MKKTVLIILAALLLVGCVSAVAALNGAARRGNGTGWRYVDEDGDGVCDNAGTGWRYVDEDGDGVCDNYATGCGRQAGRRGRNS